MGEEITRDGNQDSYMLAPFPAALIHALIHSFTPQTFTEPLHPVDIVVTETKPCPEVGSDGQLTVRSRFGWGVGGGREVCNLLIVYFLRAIIILVLGLHTH